MLNYIWLALIAVGILTAAGRDAYDEISDSYRNTVPLTVSGVVSGRPKEGDRISTSVHVKATILADHFRKSIQGDRNGMVVVPCDMVMTASDRCRFTLRLGEETPEIFKTIAEAQGGKNIVTGTGVLTFDDARGSGDGLFQFDPVHFVYLRRVTLAAFDAAGTAVQIAIGLIGIMALWLGVMKVAEEAGLVRGLARLVRPVTKRLFPDVPADHPAIGAIIMNVSANMLGLGNAATPFGLKAMEELNTLNPRAGQATNAMATFLAMNTSCITLIPATAIAVRASLGSADPARIIGPTFLASLTATICAVLIARFLQRLRVFRVREEG